MSNSGNPRPFSNRTLLLISCAIAVGLIAAAVVWVNPVIVAILVLACMPLGVFWGARFYRTPLRRPGSGSLRLSADSSHLDRVLEVESEQLRQLGEELIPRIGPASGETDLTPNHVHDPSETWYEGLRDRRTVLIGEAGSGKTTAARRLITGLISSAPADAGAVPMLATLTSWNPEPEGMDDWFTDHLADRYGINRTIVGSLVRERRVLPVLDGLDDLPASQLASAVPLLLRWLDMFPGHVLTCRTAVFQELEPLLRDSLGSAMTVGPLSTTTVIAHLRHQADFQPWQPVVQAIQDDRTGPLATTLSAPGLLSLAVNGYAGPHRKPSELTDPAHPPDAEAIRQRILTAVDPTASIRDWGATGRQRLELLTDAMGRESDGLLLWWRMAGRYGSLQVQTYVCALFLGLPVLLVTTVDGRLGLKLFGVMAAIGLFTVVGTEVEKRPRRLGQFFVRLEPGEGDPPRWAFPLFFGFILGCASFVIPPLLERRLVPSLTDRADPAVLVPLACIVAGVFFHLTGPASEPRWVRRAGDLRADLGASLVRSAAVTVLVCLPLSRLAWDGSAGEGNRLPWPAWAAVAAGVFCAGMSGSAWGRYRLTHLTLAVEGQLPYRLSRFLGAAERQGLLVAADGYGTGCFAFRHDLVREALVARGTGRLRHVRATKRIRNEIREEVLTRPESVSYLVHVSDGALETYTYESDHIRAMADEVLAEQLRFVADAGFTTFQLYRSARERLGNAVSVPGWALRGRPRSYAILAAVTGITAYEAALLLISRDTWITPALTVLGGLVSWIALRVSRTRAIKRAKPNVVRGGALLEVPLGWVVAFLLLAPLPPNRAKAVALVAAVLAIAFLRAWLCTRPYTARARASLGDNSDMWPDVPAAHLQLRAAAVQARQEWVTALARDGVMPLIRDRLSVTEDTGTAPAIPALPAIATSGLTGSRNPDQFVDTAAAKEVAFHIEALGTSSIGVSGQRGAGKSSLMQRFCTPGSSSDNLLLLVTAPTSYDPREFLIHLFAELCRKVTGDGPANDGRPGPDPGRRRSLALHTAAALTTLAGVVLLVLTLLGPELASAAHTITEHTRDLLITGGVLLLVAGVGWELLLPVLAGQRVGVRSGHTNAVAMATDHLRTLHYQLTVMRTRNTQLVLPAGLQVADGSQVQHTRQILTHPELVARFRTLLHQVALERPDPSGKVVIGIDELDKLGSAQEAERFLNDLKAVFGVRGCHFLVAVSEDALTAFGRHALDVRTTFDSAFDQVVAVRPLDLSQARKLLQLRGVQLPEPYLWLCQVLSGGLPRELLRCVTSLATHRTLYRTTDMRRLMSALIEDDARTVLSAQTRYATTLTGARGPAAAHWIAKASQAPVSFGEWEAVLRETPRIDADEYETAHAVTQVRAFLSLGATLLRTFTEGSDSDIAQRLNRVRAAGPPDPVDRLTTARAKLAAEPEASLAAVARYRTEVLNLPPE